MSAPWHVPDELLRDYQAGRLAAGRALPVEAHLECCPTCRAALPTDEVWLAASWDAIADTVLRPRLTWIERLLSTFGVPEHLARLLAGTPTLGRAWLCGLVTVLGFAVTGAHTLGAGSPALLPFLLVAPLLPLAGIAFTFGPRVDPAHELLAATPAAGPRLLLLRASAVLVAALLPAALATPFLPGPPLSGALWLLPSLALTTACLALSSRLPLPWCAGGLAALWGFAVWVSGLLSTDPLLAFHPAAQTCYGALALCCTLAIWLRRHHFDTGEPRWNLRSVSAP